MLRKMPLVLLGIIVLSVLGHAWIPVSLKASLYAISLTLKEGIVFILPLIIFGLLFKTAVNLSKSASKFVLVLLGGIVISNFTSTLLSYNVGRIVFGLDLSMALPTPSDPLVSLWTVHLPKLIGNDVALLCGLSLGILGGWFKPQFSSYLALRIEQLINQFLKGFLFVIPLFILGFVIKMCHDEVMLHIVRNYVLIFAFIACAVYLYIALIYFITNRGQPKGFMESFKNMLPAAVVGFGSMSSVAAMPLSILGARKNGKNPDLTASIIPATVNIHLIGDCFAIPIFAFAVLKNFGMAEPSFLAYLTFALYFVMAIFSVATVPGGGILVMLPILESCLGFNAEMLSLITALYILFDPIISSANILGNGGFAMVLDRLLMRKSLKRRAEEPTA